MQNKKPSERLEGGKAGNKLKISSSTNFKYSSDTKPKNNIILADKPYKTLSKFSCYPNLYSAENKSKVPPDTIKLLNKPKGQKSFIPNMSSQLDFN